MGCPAPTKCVSGGRKVSFWLTMSTSTLRGRKRLIQAEKRKLRGSEGRNTERPRPP